MTYRRDLVHPERAHDNPIVLEGSQHLKLPAGVQVGIERLKVASTGYQGDASGATAERGKALAEFTATRVAQAIRAVKDHAERPRLIKESFRQSRIWEVIERTAGWLKGKRGFRNEKKEQHDAPAF